MKIINRRKFLIKSAFAAGGFSGAAAGIGRNSLRSTKQYTSGRHESDVLVAQLDKIPSKHPSLHFDAEGLKKLRQKASESHLRYAEILYQWVERNRKWSPLDMPYPAGREVALEQSGAFVTNGALAFLLSERKEYLDLTRRWVLEMLEYPVNEGRNYGFGIYAAGLARVYDWLHGYLTEDEREMIRKRLKELVGQLYRGSIPGSSESHWWAGVHMHHDHWIPVGGYGEAALALLGEVDDASMWAAHARRDFEFALSWLGDDGAWHEGAADWCYTLAPLLWFYGAWNSVVGENLHEIPWLRNTALYRLYHRLPDESYVYLNDSFRSGRYNTSGSASCHLLRRLASLYRDGYAQWLAEKDEAFDMKPGPKGVFQAPYENLSFGGAPTEYPHPDSQCAAWNMLWYDPAVKPVSPHNLPRVRHFENQGVVIMRTGWDEESAVVSMSCAPLAGHRCAERIRAGEDISPGNYSHAHADYTAFTFFAGGQYIIIPPGYARRASGFQNTVSVNGADFLVDPSINVKIVTCGSGTGFSYAVADASDAFTNVLGVHYYRRYIIMLDTGCMIIYDDLRLNSSGRRRRPYNRFEWRVHSDPAIHALSLSGIEANWKPLPDNQSRLTMHILEPKEYAWERTSLTSVQGKNMLEALRVVRPEWYSGEMKVLSAWSWMERPDNPALIRNKDFLAVLWKQYPEMPAVGFAFSNETPSDFSHPDLRNRDLILFGHDTSGPDVYTSIKDGKAQ